MKTLRVRIKDKHAKILDAMACECNLVWNYTNDLSYRHLKRTGEFFSAFEIAKYTAGACKEGLTIHSQTVQAVTEEFVTRRRQFRKAKLRWRVSKGARKSLGWIPFKVGAVRYKNGQLRYAGQYFSVWDSYDLSNYELRSGSFSQDASGLWFGNICVDIQGQKSAGTKAIGIDLGLNQFATLSTGEKIQNPRIYRSSEKSLIAAQLAKKKKRVTKIHAKITNQRTDFLHKLSTRLVQENGAIFIGNVSASRLAQTSMAKSVFDAGWSSFRTMLQYKSTATGILFELVDETYSTVTCSTCNARGGPSGLKGLRIREWTCSECGERHCRDTNAAKNILRRGRATLVVGDSV